MSWKSEHRRVYEKRVTDDALRRLAMSIRLESIPFSQDELLTLVKRHRDASHGAEMKLDRLKKYQANLISTYGHKIVDDVSSHIADIMNQIGYEEK